MSNAHKSQCEWVKFANAIKKDIANDWLADLLNEALENNVQTETVELIGDGVLLALFCKRSGVNLEKLIGELYGSIETLEETKPVTPEVTLRERQRKQVIFGGKAYNGGYQQHIRY